MKRLIQKAILDMSMKWTRMKDRQLCLHTEEQFIVYSPPPAVESTQSHSHSSASCTDTPSTLQYYQELGK